MSLRAALMAYEEELRLRGPQVLDALADGVAPGAVAARLAQLQPPRQPTDDVLTWFGWHDGNVGQDLRTPVFGGWALLSLDQALGTVRRMQDIWAHEHLYQAVPICSQDGQGELWIGPEHTPAAGVWLARPLDVGGVVRVASSAAELVEAWTTLMRLGMTWRPAPVLPNGSGLWSIAPGTPLPGEVLARAGYPA